jgi:hypothetical protein
MLKKFYNLLELCLSLLYTSDIPKKDSRTRLVEALGL